MSEREHIQGEGRDEPYEAPKVEDLESPEGDVVVTAAGFTVG
jgi:hypothetical protein